MSKQYYLILQNNNNVHYYSNDIEESTTIPQNRAQISVVEKINFNYPFNKYINIKLILPLNNIIKVNNIFFVVFANIVYEVC